LRTVQLAASAAALIIALSATQAHSACGDYNDDGQVTATDAFGVLAAAVGYDTCELHHCDVDDSGGISATDALTVLMAAVGQPVPLTCPLDPECVADLDFFFESVWTPILTDCVNCHNAAGIASNTDHVLRTSSEDGYLEYNFDVLRNLDDIGKGDLLLSKPLGVAHGGGQRLGMTEQGPLYQSLVELLDRFDNPVPDCGGVPADFYAGVSYLDSGSILRKAALLFAGRLPTTAEIAAVAGGGDTALRSTVRGLMTGTGFESFLHEGANDRLLTDQFLLGGPSAFDVLRSDWDYPHVNDRINAVQQAEGDEAAWQAWEATNRGLTHEPLRLISHIVTSERPYTEIVTADYMMVNPWSAVPYQAGVAFADNDDENEWHEATNQGYRLPGYPHAGLLTSPMLLGRYPSTATNRNRARARWTYRFFLGVDIEGLAPRPIDPDALADTDNPTLYNPHCAVCHSVHDPVAGTYQNFGDVGHYRENETDSLPWTYKDSDLYQWGDLWYRDMRNPGFNNVEMPSAYDDASLPWLGAQIASDPRFAMGAVRFWFPAVFGQQPLVAPVEPSDANYRTRLRAFAAQDEQLRALADVFTDGSAGTGQNGAYNLKDLLVEMAMSPTFTAATATDIDEERSDELAEVGLVRLLTPEQLHRKLVSVTGYSWAPGWAPDSPQLLGTYRLFYGGMDSAGITVRATDLNALMSTVVQRLANEAACPITVSEFSQAAGQRLLFPHVEPTDTPDTGNGESAIRTNIVHLHDRLLGETLATDAAEVDRTLALFDEIRQLRIAQGKSTYLPWGPAYCQLDFSGGQYIERDDNHTIRSWIAVLNYLMGDYRFLYE